MGKTVRTDAVDDLFEAIMTLKDREEFYSFFEDICTTNEILSLIVEMEAVISYLTEWE